MTTSLYPSFVELALFAILAILLVCAAISDARRFTIPNSISISVTALFFIAWFILPVQTSILSHVGSASLVLIIGMLLFRLGLFGGGDVKLWAAAALWFGFGTFHTQLMYISLVGGLLGISLFVARISIARWHGVKRGVQVSAVPQVLQDGAAVPYGVAIAAGTILTLNQTPFFAALWG